MPASKVDVLFVVDNSPSMGDKQQLLATSVHRLLRGIVEGPGHAPIRDLHVGVISSSLGLSSPDDICGDDSRRNDRGRLLTLAKDGFAVSGATRGFLALGADGISDLPTLERATANLIEGVGQTGCGFEAQLESLFRFLVQPDPPFVIVPTRSLQAEYRGIDSVLLEQRRAFLRPDSAVVVVMLCRRSLRIAEG